MNREYKNYDWLLADILLVILLVVLLVPSIEVLMGHQGSRLAFTAALSEQGRLIVDDFKYLMTVDFAVLGDHTYSDKAPGQPFLMVPIYLIGKILGFGGFQPGLDKPQYFGNMVLWWQTLWSSIIPAIVMALLMRRTATKISGSIKVGFISAAAIAISTQLFPFSGLLFSHVLAACLCYACWYVADGNEIQQNPWRLTLAGALGGMAVLVEYTSAITVIIVGLGLLVTNWRRIYAYILGGIPFAVLLMTYNKIAWGSPFTMSYSNSGTFAGHHAKGLFGIQLPDIGLTLSVLFGERGLLLLTPICLAAVIGLILLLVERDYRRTAIISLAIFLLYVAVQGGWSSVTAGSSPGPRYVVPALPFLATGVAICWQWSWPTVTIFTMLGSIPMFLAHATMPLASPNERFAILYWIDLISKGKWGWTIFHYDMSDWIVHVGSWIIATAIMLYAAMFLSDEVIEDR